MVFDGNITIKPVNNITDDDYKFVSLNRIKNELRDLLYVAYDDYDEIELENVTIGNVAHVFKVIDLFSVLIIPQGYIVSNESNICTNKILGANIQVILFYRLNTESASDALIEAVDILISKFQSKKVFQTLNGSVGSAFINKINFVPYNNREIRLFTAEIGITVEF